VVNFFKWEDLNDAVLVGHSYAGWVISGVVEQVLPRVGSIVFLDAFMPEGDGTRFIDNAPEVSRRVTLAAFERGEVSLPAPTAATLDVNEKDRPWVDSKMTPQPLGVLLQPIGSPVRATGWRRRPTSGQHRTGTRFSISISASAKPTGLGARSKFPAAMMSWWTCPSGWRRCWWKCRKSHRPAPFR
jgi:pimeloyl-ACP methyl ester carboxylesterase